MNRYARQLAVDGMNMAAQARLLKSRLLVVGAGGLSASLLPYLVGAGVGHIRLIDPDIVEESNLHRQTLFRISDLGLPKALAAANALKGLNADCRIEPITTRLDPSNTDDLSDGCDLVLDCADSFAASYILSDHAWQAGLPLISASALGRSGYAGAFCGGAPSLRAVFPDLPQRAGNCAQNGVIGPVVGMIGCIQAQMALTLLTGMSPSPLGRIVTYDAASHRFGGFSFREASEPDHRHVFISEHALRLSDLLIDLRAPEEGPPLRDDFLRLTVDQVGPELRPNARVVMCCRSGLRAWNAAERLAQHWNGPIALISTG
ncbi:HesA/MoeB/ThiF family protein [Paracoccus sp. 11-3]|uniref:HesA/MoeB/ThiF family protein n=1 Tax=Paracoccus amoyensis TaxID=2760093 RepID=A0A926GDH1_9RHOB|nr:HesA/MoeB/ThiF family protein [Paracoccus amoyensis]MBC9245374.1 HesA/MoeB/ThiF family protein [Paracoccus amoyensis]